VSEVVDRFPRAPKSKYAWGLWTDGQIHKCERGVDFMVSAYAFVKAAHSWAGRNNLTPRTRTFGEFVYVQFVVGRPKRKHALRPHMRIVRAGT
jgi:hypothetical protein